MGPKKQQVTPSKQQQQITYQQKHQHQLEEQRIEIDELKKEIKLLKETVAGLKMDVTFMNSRLEISHQVTSVLHRQMDDLQQYSRRYSVLLENVPKKTNETSQEVEEKVEDILINDYKVDSSNLALEFDKLIAWVNRQPTTLNRLLFGSKVTVSAQIFTSIGKIIKMGEMDTSSGLP